MPMILRIFMLTSLVLVLSLAIATGVLIWADTQSLMAALPADRAQSLITQHTWLIVVVDGVVVGVVLLVELLFVQHFRRMIAAVTSAAHAVEVGRYDVPELTPIAERKDDIGQVARAFQSMAQQVRGREQQLKNQVQALRIEIDEVKKNQQVLEITESDSFQDLQRRAAEFRARAHGRSQPASSE